MAKSLVIVESPTKAKTIAQFLGKDFIIESSIGHIRDLPDSAKDIPPSLKKMPWARLGIDLEHDFKPFYVIPEGKKQQVQKLKNLLKDADTLYLATDEDREGESISWHLREVLQPKVPTHRLVFHEITRKAIQNALNSPRDIDTRLVEAQETRRLLDRLYGYEISPVLWRKIAPALSAGRVQSVAVRMIVQRERERIAFRSAAYWDLAGNFQAPQGGELQALLVGLQGRRIASGRDFDERTGKLKESAGPPVLLDGKEAQELAANLSDATWRVSKVEPRPFSENPPPPFITSTLQQEANRKLGMSSRDTMRVAQALYERGFITYMRTDSTTLSEEALQAARSEIASRYGEEYLSESPRIHHSKVKNAQEAHEAIRPAGDAFRLPDSVRDELDPRELRLYEMIWKRTVAGQMAPARGHRTTVQIEGKEALFQASGKQVEFPGYLRAYVEGSDDPEAELADREKLLPPLKEGDAMTCLALEPQEHVTQPPRRFSEAALIRDLEKEGIGRPSTYANIIETINRRQYVAKRNNVLVPTFTAFAVVQLLEEHFRHLVDLKFTARMEDSLDAISRGEQKALPYLREFYYGNDEITGLKDLLKADIDPRKACTIPLGEDSQSRPINVRIGKFGPYLERNDERASLPEDLSPDELTLERAVELLEREKVPDVLGSDPASGKNVYLKTGRYGPYFQLGENGETPHIKSLLPGQKPEEVNLTEALRVLSLPRTIGADAATGEDVVVDLGRYGPYVKRGKETRSLSGPDALFSLTLEEAAELFRQEKARRRFGPAPVRELGAHPDSGATVTLMTGRYGPYVTDGETNASLPRTLNPDALTLAEAVTLIQERVAKGPPVKRKPAKAGTSRTKGSAKSRRTAPSKESSGAG